MNEARRDLIAALMGRVLDALPAQALGLRSEAFPVEEHLQECVAAARLVSATATRPLRFVFGAFAAEGGVISDDDLYVAPPHEAAAYATRSRNDPDAPTLIYLSNARPPGEAGLAELFEVTGRELARAFARELGLPTLEALSATSRRRLRERLEVADFSTLLNYHEHLLEDQRELAELHALPALELIPKELKARELTRPTLSWAKSWDKILGTRAENRLKEAARALEDYSDRAAIDEALLEGALCPAQRGSEALWAARLSRKCARLASGHATSGVELVGLNQRLLRLLMKGRRVIDELLGGGEGAPLSVTEVREEDALEHLSSDTAELSLDPPTLYISTDGDDEPDLLIKGRRYAWALKWLKEKTSGALWERGGFVSLRQPRPLLRASAPAEVAFGQEHLLSRQEIRDAPAELLAHVEIFRARRRELLSAISAWCEGRLEGEPEDADFDPASHVIDLLELTPLTITAQLEAECRRYVDSYGALMSCASRHYTRLKQGVITWLLNLDVVYVRAREVVTHARLLPTHPLAIERALLWHELQAPPPALPQLLSLKGSPDLINLDSLRGQPDGLYLSASSARPTAEGLADAARAGLRYTWRVLAHADLITALDVEVVDAAEPAVVVDALAAELSALFAADAEVGGSVHAQVWFSRTRDMSAGGEDTVALDDLSELTRELLSTTPGDGPSLTLQPNYIEHRSGIPRHLVITSVATPFSPHNPSSRAPQRGLNVEYTPGIAGNIQSVRVQGRAPLDARHALLSSIGHTAGMGLSAPTPRAALEGVIAHTLVARGGWPLTPSASSRALFAYDQRGEHFMMTVLAERVFEASLRDIFGRDLDDALRGLLSMRDLRELLPKALDPGFDARKIVGDRAKLRGFQLLQDRATAPTLVLNLDGDEGVRWAKSQERAFGTKRRADLLLFESDEGLHALTRVRVIELKAREHFSLKRDGARVAAQAQIVAQRLREIFTSARGERDALAEGLRAIAWLGAGYQREAMRWREVLQDLERRLRQRDAPQVSAEVVVVLHGGSVARHETLSLPRLDTAGEAMEQTEQVHFLLVEGANAPPTDTPSAPSELEGMSRAPSPVHTPPRVRDEAAASDEGAPLTAQGEPGITHRERGSSAATLEPPPRPRTPPREGASEAPPHVTSQARGEAPAPPPPPSTQRSGLDVEARYREILSLFTEFGVEVLRPPAEAHHEGPGFYIARVVPGEGTKTTALERLTNDLKLRLGLEATQEPRSYIDRGAVVFEIPKRDEERYFIDTEALLARAAWREDALYAPIGEDLRGEIVGINFSSSDSPHLLIAGTTGSGKSIALESILYGLVESKRPEELELYIIDPKGTELAEFERYEHQRGVIGFDGEDAIKTLEASVAEMQARLKRFKRARARSLPEYNRAAPPEERIPWRVIVLDEYADLISDKEERKTIERLLQRLAQKARSSGVHIILATQKPSAEVLSTVVRSNLPAQLALRVKTAADSRIILDEGGAEALAGKGDAFFKTARGMTRIQCAMLRRGALRGIESVL